MKLAGWLFFAEVLMQRIGRMSLKLLQKPWRTLVLEFSGDQRIGVIVEGVSLYAT